jgi:hypothetical protein
MKILVNNYPSLHEHGFVEFQVCIVLFSCLSLGMFSWLKWKVFMNP